MSFLHSRVQVVRDTIATITQILANRDIPVIQQGLKAYVEYNPNGEAIKVCLPHLPDTATDELILSVQGFLDHEVGHLLFTTNSEILKIAHDPELMEMHNIIEDPFVERMMKARFPGSSENLNQLYAFFINKIVEKNFKNLKESGELDPFKFFGVLTPCISRAWSGVDQFSEYMKDKWELVKPITNKIEKYYPTIVADVRSSKTTAQNIVIARKILEAIMVVPDDDDEDSSHSSKPKSSSSGSSHSSGSSKASSSKSPSGSKKSSKDLCVDEEGRYDEEEKDSEKDDDEKEKSDEEKSERDDDEPDSDEPDSDDDAETSGDEESDEESDDEWTIGDDDSLSKVTSDDISSSLSKEIEKMAEKDAGEYVVYTTERDLITTAPLTRSESEYERMMKTIDDKVAEYIGPMSNDLQRAFVSLNKSYWRTSQKSGRVNPASLSRLSVGDNRVFRKKVEHTATDYDVSILVDLSGSMSSRAGEFNRAMLAMISAYAVGCALDKININFEILGFTTKGSHSTDVRGEGAIYSKCARYDNIYMPIYKSFDERWTPTCFSRIARTFADQSFMSENVDGECLEITARRLMAQKAKGKAMLVLSDGSPACRTSNYAALSNHLKKVTRDIEKAGIKLVGIGINTDSVNSYYSNPVVLNNVTELPSVLVSKIREIILS